MRPVNNRAGTAGLVLHALVGGLMMLTGAEKLVRSAPPEALVRYGLGEQARLIGAGACLSALLLLAPRTSSPGALLVSAFWGGAICIHMANGEPYLFQAALLALTGPGRTCAGPRRSAAVRPPPARRGEPAPRSDRDGAYLSFASACSKNR